MRSKFMSLLAVIGAVTVLVLAANTVALATTGQSILAGKINTASKMTSISRTTPGTGLQVKTKSTANSPFAVNGKGKVANLNADTVDGKDSSVLGTRALVWAYAGTTASSTSRTFKTSTLPAGTYLVNYEVYLDTTTYPSEGELDCYLRRNADDIYAAEGSTVGGSHGTALNGTGLFTLVAPGTVQLTCRTSAATTWSIAQDEPVRITAVPITGYTLKGSPSVSRVAGKTK